MLATIWRPTTLYINGECETRVGHWLRCCDLDFLPSRQVWIYLDLASAQSLEDVDLSFSAMLHIREFVTFFGIVRILLLDVANTDTEEAAWGHSSAFRSFHMKLHRESNEVRS